MLAIFVFDDSLQNNFAGLAGRQFTAVLTGLAGLAGTAQVQRFYFGEVFIGIEPADQALAIGKALASIGFDLDGTIGRGGAIHIQGNHMQFQIIHAGGPALGFNADHFGGWPQIKPGGPGQDLAAGIAVFQLGRQGVVGLYGGKVFNFQP